MSTQKRVAYNPYVHGSMDAWREGTPKKRGYYTVMTQPQKALYVTDGYFWTGDNGQWVTPGHCPTKAVIRYLPESWRETR